METRQFKFRDQIASFESHLDFYLKNKSTDCILYSEDGSKFKVHKELLGQTDFLRKILSGTKDHCCGTIEVICPCSKEELKHLVNFLYDGEIHCEKESDALKIIDNLRKIFGFQRNLNLKYQNEAYFTSHNNMEAITVTKEGLENIPDNSDVQEIVIIPVKEEPVDQGKDAYTDQGENDNDFDSQGSENDFQVEHSKCRSENDNVGNTTAEGIDFRNGSKFEHGVDEIQTLAQTDAEKNSKARNIQKKSKCDKNVVIIPLRGKGVSVAGDEGKKDNVLDNVEKKKKLQEISGKKVKRPSMKKHPKQKHVHTVHLKIRPFECEQCQKSFIKKNHLKDHINAIHLKIKPYECHQCKMSFAQKSQLNTHVKIHQEIKAHKCQYCNKLFSRKHNLSGHVERVHLKIKPLKKFLCNECEAPFEHKQFLEYHMNKVHLNVKPYKCNLCENVFFIEAHLKKHLKGMLLSCQGKN